LKKAFILAKVDSMIINWYGESCFKIVTGGVTLLVDPFESNTGFTPPRFKADITLTTLTKLPLEDFFGEEKKETNQISGPGEFEIQGIRVVGVPLRKETNAEEMRTVFMVEAEGMKLGFLGYISTDPDAIELEYINEVDIACIPGGGAPFLSVDKAVKLIKNISPKIVIPTLFKIPGLKRKAGDAKEFIHALESNGESTVSQEKLTIKKNDLPEHLKSVVLKKT